MGEKSYELVPDQVCKYSGDAKLRVKTTKNWEAAGKWVRRESGTKNTEAWSSGVFQLKEYIEEV